MQTGIARRITAPVRALIAADAVAAIPLLHAVFGAPQAFVRIAIWGMPSCVLIFSLVALDMRNRSLSNRIVASLGVASYSIYLIHPYVIGVAEKIIGARANFQTWTGIATACAALGVVCVSGYACHARIERPMVSVLNRWLRPPSRSHNR
ncbi:acyltransferase family protein [Burkholderia cepacia]|uniref:acyltransferase family protein n=1 Tax=Burkholderia cepacia TaxID=292 RepID=UPI00398EEA5A